MKRVGAAWIVVLLVGCAMEIDGSSDAIVDGSRARPWMCQRAVNALHCTGTLISPRHVLTAAHCAPSVIPEQVIPPYGMQPYTPLWAFEQKVFDDPWVPPGVHPSEDELHQDLEDVDGVDADIAIYTLDAPFDPDVHAVVATLAFEFEFSAGYQVGRGEHDDGDNPTQELRYSASAIATDDSSGTFRTFGVHTNSGDSGGPFYSTEDHFVVGALSGSEDGFDAYTSIPRHLPRILRHIGWTWPHHHSQEDVARIGTTIRTFDTPSHRVCQYACDRISSCVAYDYNANSDFCRLLSAVTRTETLTPSGTNRFSARR